MRVPPLSAGDMIDGEWGARYVLIIRRVYEAQSRCMLDYTARSGWDLETADPRHDWGGEVLTCELGEFVWSLPSDSRYRQKDSDHIVLFREFYTAWRATQCLPT
jgi:hypothetical protein